MAVKKSELYGSLWASCDSLRGGMDSSQYKDYILTLLFVKYVSDKYKGVVYGEIDIPEGGSFDDMLALIGQKNIGEGMDKVIAKLAEANNLRGVIDNAHFNVPEKLGSGQEMVDKLSNLLAIFRDKMPDFGKNRADGDDIIGDAYEFLMKKFATESGKSKGQFYTPAEVSRVLAHVIGIEKAVSGESTLYDPACGSGSLLIRAAEAAPKNVAVFGQEKDITTAGLARMNIVLHNRGTGEIKSGNTFSSPQYTDPDDESALQQFDFAVVNPPFSDKNWTDGLQDYGQFDGYGERPPQKNGDFAWLLHVIKSLKRNGKAAVILPHGVLFRGNAEATIRRALVDKGYIKGIIGLPANLFYGTGIPACIIVIDKEKAEKRGGIFMIDASRDFIKDGNKNRLRERDIYKITTVFNAQTEIPYYSRFIPLSEIQEKNDYNLNIPRYIQSGAREDIQNLSGHLKGGIPIDDIDSLNTYWTAFPQLKPALFKPFRKDFYSIAAEKEAFYGIIEKDPAFEEYAHTLEAAFEDWAQKARKPLSGISDQTKPKELIRQLADALIKAFKPIALIDIYDVYEVLLSYWNETMGDDVYLIMQDGYAVIREIDSSKKPSAKKNAAPGATKTEWDGKIIPKELVIEHFFFTEKTAIDKTEQLITVIQEEVDELLENAEEDSIIAEVLTEKKILNKALLKQRLAELNKESGSSDDAAVLQSLSEKQNKIDEQSKLLKGFRAALDEKTRCRYAELSDKECLKLLLDLKWFRSISNGIYALYESVNYHISARITELAERYDRTLPKLETETAALEQKVKAHLHRMGIEW